MIDPKVLQKIADDISDPFVEGAHLDLGGFPDFNHPPAEESFIDPRFGGLVHEQGKDMRKELAALANDPTVLAELAKRDPAAARELEKRREEEVAEQFVASHPDYYVCEGNADALYAWLEAKGLTMTPENLDRAYRDLSAAGKLTVSPNQPRVVPVAEQIRLSRMAASGDAQNALAGFLQQRLPLAVAREVERAEDYFTVESIINRPENQPLLREATVEVWLWSHPQVKPTPELRQYFAEYTRDMLAFTIKTLDHAYFLYLDQRETEREAGKAAAAQEPAKQDAPTAANLEELSDAEVADLMRGVRRERARGAV